MNQVLVSLLTIGVLASFIGIGTYAYFSDTETSTGNSVQAGILDLTLGTQTFHVLDMKPSYTRTSGDIVLTFSENPGKLYKTIQNIQCSPSTTPIEPRDTECATYANEIALAACTAQCTISSVEAPPTVDPACLANCMKKACIDQNMLDQTWFDLSRKDGSVYTTLLADGQKMINELKNKPIYLGYYTASAAAPASVTIQQSFHLNADVTNWAQGQTCTFDEVFTLLQDNAPAPQGCINPTGMQGQDNHIDTTPITTCPGDLRTPN
jgi:predicted ribosomally synthesized peptide with SipW-like signal peptide